MEIFYLEDDEAIAGAVKRRFERENWRVTIFKSIADARRALCARLPSVLLVDWNLPDGRGDDFCRWARARWRDLPLLFLTVRSDPRDIVAGFECGADDYVAKPFDSEVLCSRVRALLRRSGDVSGDYLSCGEIAIDRRQMRVFTGAGEVVLSASEYALLELLMRNKGRTLTREGILRRIWDDRGNYVNDNTLTVTVKRLREKLGQPDHIRTVRSIGYRMEDER